MSAWDDATSDPADAIPIRSVLPPVSAPVDFWWRQVGTDIEVRISPDLLAPGPGWQHQHAPTGLLTLHLAGDPDDAVSEPDRWDDPALNVIETPGPTIIRQAEWDEETQTWRT